ncbi:uncharacterized protein LOC100175492 [Ciona intestinalis]
MDEVKIWYRKLSPTEVVQSMFHVDWPTTTTEPDIITTVSSSIAPTPFVSSTTPTSEITTHQSPSTNSTELTTAATKPTGSNSYRYAILAGCIVVILVVLIILLLLWRRKQAKKRGFLAVANEMTTTSVMSDRSFSL